MNIVNNWELTDSHGQPEFITINGIKYIKEVGHPPKDDYAEKANKAAREYCPNSYGSIAAYLIETEYPCYCLESNIRTCIQESFIDGIKWANKNVHYPDNWIIMEKPDQEAIDKANEVSEVYTNKTKRYFKYSGFMDGVNWQKNRKK